MAKAIALAATRLPAFRLEALRSAIVAATVRPMTPLGMPVRGGAGAITVPLGLLRGREIWCGGAKAIPAAKWFGNPGAS